MTAALGTPVEASALVAMFPALAADVGVPSGAGSSTGPGLDAIDDVGLVELGWIGPAGLTATGRDLLCELTGAPSVTVRAQDAAGSSLTRILVGHTCLLVVDVTSADATPPGEAVVTVRRHPASALPVVLGRLAALRPTEVVEGDEFELDEVTVDARVAAVATAVPDRAPAWLREVWARPWRRWRVDADDGPHLHHIDTGDTGQLEVRPRGRGRVALAVRPEGLVWGDLQAVPGRLLPVRTPDPDASDW